MRVIKLALLSFVFLFIVITSISLLIPSHIRISKATNLAANTDSVFTLIGDTTKWKLWHPAFMPGDSSYKASSVQIIPQTQNDSVIIMRLQQGGKPPVINGWQLYSHQQTDSITLQWYMDFNLKWYPWQKFGSLFYESTYGAMMEKGLENIKQISTH